jgi:hypothetical protein
MAAFVTLCETYIGIEPHFNLWNYFSLIPPPYVRTFGRVVRSIVLSKERRQHAAPRVHR